MNTSTPFGPMPTALEALRALADEFDTYAEAMRAIGRGHEDYGCQRRLARMVLHAVTIAPEPIAPVLEPAAKRPIARTTRAPKVKAEAPIAPPVDTANMKRDELFKHFKQTAPVEDLTFFLNATHDTISQKQIDEATVLVGLFDANGKLTIPRPEYYRRLVTLQDHWREDARKRWILDDAADRVATAKASAWLDARELDAERMAA